MNVTIENVCFSQEYIHMCDRTSIHHLWWVYRDQELIVALGQEEACPIQETLKMMFWALAHSLGESEREG